jgi:hypothetical protein
MSNDTFSQWLSGLNFEYWSTGQHKIDPPVFFEKWAKGEGRSRPAGRARL